MDDELSAFRSQWRREVGARYGPALTHAAPRPDTAPRAPRAPRAAADGALAVPLEALSLHDPVQASRPQAPPRVPAKAPERAPDTLLQMLDALAQDHAASVERAAAARAQALDDDTVGAADQGPRAPGGGATDAVPDGAALAPAPRRPTSVHAMYADDPERACPAAALPDDVWVLLLLQLIAPAPAPAPVPAVREGMAFEAPAAPWRPWTGPDYVALERLGRVCWRLRRLTAHARVWKDIVQHTYAAPFPRIERPLGSWRDAFVGEPRVRMHGVYIASCRYTQHGLSEENVWVRRLHVVRYYRYLRFFPNGLCLSWLTTEAPGDAVPVLWPGLRTRGLSVGHWRWLPDAGPPPARRGATIVVDDLRDPSLRHYTFQMTLALRPSRGSWHRLDMLEYASLHLRTGEVLPIPDRHAQPFLFSRVLSYGV